MEICRNAYLHGSIGDKLRNPFGVTQNANNTEDCYEIYLTS